MPPEDSGEICFALKVPNPADIQSLVCQTPQMPSMNQVATMMRSMQQYQLQQFMNMMGGCGGTGSSGSRPGELDIFYGAGPNPKRRKMIGMAPVEDDSQQSQTGDENTPPTRPAVLTPTPSPTPTPAPAPPSQTAHVQDALQVYNPVEAAHRIQNALEVRKDLRKKTEEEAEEEERQDVKTTKKPKAKAKQDSKHKVSESKSDKADKKTQAKLKAMPEKGKGKAPKSSGSKRPHVMKDGDSTVFYRMGKIQRNQGCFRVFLQVSDKKDRKFSINKYGESGAWRKACELLESGE